MFPLPPLPLLDNCLFLDNSALELISTCQRQAQYYILHKREKASDRSALKFGGILHKMLEANYRNLSASPDLRLSLMLDAATEGFASWSPDPSDYRNYDSAVGFAQRYIKEYPIEEFEVPVSRVELPFATPIGEFAIGGRTIKIIWQGRIDLIPERSGTMFFMDHKSTSMMGPTYFKEFDLSSQFKGYGWATKELMGIMPAYGVVNALGIRAPSKTGKQYEFQRYSVRFTEDDLDEWRSDTMHLIGTFIQNYFAGFFPRSTKWCVGKYGACQYFDVCILPRGQREMMLSTGDYKDVTWNPLT